MIQLLVSINVAYITITRPVIKDRPRSLLYRPISLPHRPRSLAEFTKTGRDHSGRDPERPRSPATNAIITGLTELSRAYVINTKHVQHIGDILPVGVIGDILIFADGCHW